MKRIRRARSTNRGSHKNYYETMWERSYTDLVKFKRKRGNCNVPANWSENESLGKWVNTQRFRKKSGWLGEDRIRRLEQLGFVWDAREARWERKFGAMAAYKLKHHHCHVSTRHPELGRWVYEQRKLKKAGRISPDRSNRLDKLGFVWNSREACWEKMFAALTQYRRKYGDWNVIPTPYAYSPLARWVSNQRELKKKGKLSRAHIRRLNEIGFPWFMRKPR